MGAASSANVIALDGPAASGKSSVARRVARRLGWNYVNTGSMYRAATWAALKQGVDPADPAAVAAFAEDMQLDFPLHEGEMAAIHAGKPLIDELTCDAVNGAVSLIARVPAVREKLVARQRALPALGPLVMEGRDIGSVVFPDAPYKFYVDASEEVRASRRKAQGHADSVGERDRLDSTRATSPLVTAPDAVVIDSSNLNLDEVVERVLQVLRDRGLQPMPSA